MKIQFAKESERQLMKLKAGFGQVFVSDGSGYGIKYSDIFFTKNKDNYYIAIGKRKAIKLTKDQMNVIGDFFFQE